MLNMYFTRLTPGRPALLTIMLLWSSVVSKSEDAKNEAIPDSIKQQFDTNGDGKWDAAEKADWNAYLAKAAAEKKQHDLDRFDTNKNGQLDAEELKVRQAATKAANEEAVAELERMKKMAEAESKQRDLEVMNAPIPAALKKYDANSDGKWDTAEKAAWDADMAKAIAESKQRDLDRFDANKDGELDAEELKVRRSARKVAYEKAKAELERMKKIAAGQTASPTR